MLRYVAMLLSGNAVSQLVNVATILFVVSTFFSPGEFGVYAVLMSYVGILSSVACLRYELAIVSTNRNLASNNIAVGSIAIAGSFSVIAYVALKLGELFVGDALLFGSPPVLIVALIFFRALDQVCAAIFYRREAYLDISILKFAQAIVLFVCFLGVGLLDKGVNGLLLATVASYLSFAVLAIARAQRFGLIRGIHLSRSAVLLRRNTDFAKFNAPHAFIDNCLANGLNLILVVFAGPTVVGYFNYMHRILKAPLGLIFGAVSQVLFRTAAQARANGLSVSVKLREILWVTGGILLAAAVGVVSAYILFPDIVLFNGWSGLRHHMLAFALWMLVPFLFSPFAVLPVVYERQRQFFLMATGFNLLSLTVLSGLLWLEWINGAFILVGTISALYYVGITTWIFRVVASEEAQ